MKLNKVNEVSRYLEIINRYRQKGCLTNDYLRQEVDNLVASGLLYESCGANNAYLFVKKEECLRLYYYINDLQEKTDFSTNENLVVELVFRGNMGVPETEIEYLLKSGFHLNLRRDQYGASYKDLDPPMLISGVNVRKAKTIDEVSLACNLFNQVFDHFSGDYISKEMEQSLFECGSMWIATDMIGKFAGALHQTIDNNIAWLSHVAVLEEFRGRGVGQALLDTFVYQNQQNDNGRYMLWVQSKNEPAVRLYQKKGFKYTNKSTISMIKINK